jgi:peptidoglycan/xylan/chitin deacetylase (PgdA/CDA1 family)
MRTRLALLFALVATLLPATAFAAAPQAASSADVRTITRFDTTDKVVVLTFDAGADRGYAASILDTLRDKGVHATFGMSGLWAQANLDLVQRMVAEGHQLINHSWSHPSFTGLTSQQRVAEVTQVENFIRDQTGVELQPYFRPPYGDYNDTVLADVASAGYTVNVLWSLDTLGWNGLSVAQINQRVLDNVQPGDILLLHVGSQSQDGPALGGLIDGLRARGYHFATVDDLAQASQQTRYFPETGHTVGHAFLRFWERFGGLATFGYPLTDEYTDPYTGFTVQYFERERFEYQPGAWPEHYDVLLGRLGFELTAGRGAEAPFQPIVAQPDAHCDVYAATGHRLCFGFRDYWNANGGLTIFGYPLSEEFTENGYTVQYFERARFEYHPEHAGTPYVILLGRLGADQLAERGLR